MSYLNALRLHFAGEFQANVSTVNNDPAHFHNAAFQSSYQLMQGDGMTPPNGWFNPEGDASFRLLGCRVTGAWTAAGAAAPSDPVFSCAIADSDVRVPAKLVDLDSEQQLVSEIWGLEVRIANARGETLVRGDFAPAAFADIWDRATGGGDGDIGAGATYQSVLQNLQWADVSASPVLSALRAAAGDGLLSIKFNFDGLNMDFKSPKFMCGRIVGTIGSATSSEPKHLVVGRQFMAQAAAGGNFFTPVGGINFCTAVVDAAAERIYLDLGNALSTASPGGPINNLGDLEVTVLVPAATPGGSGAKPVALGKIPATGAGGYVSDSDWYARSAGVVVLPLTAAQVQLAATAPLSITGAGTARIAEWTSGAFVRADRFVFRMSPGDRARIPVYAMQWGRPLSGVDVAVAFDPSQLQQTLSAPPYVGAGPTVAAPTAALAFSATVRTDGDGVALVDVLAGDPGTPRWFNGGADYGIDGQVYGVRPTFADTRTYSGPDNQWNFISFLIWSGFAPSTPPTWTDIQPILQQYANLYPVMNRFLNLADFDSVVGHGDLLRLAFGLDPADPNSMPVTRDLSPAKRDAILAWLKNPLAGPVPAPKPRLALEAAAVAPLIAGPPPPRGGKAAAAARRLILQVGRGAAS
ncbi:MAG TPA: hypothetical protein VFE10_00590 [Phenylobacterium sp.]|jgi:hypothetical protein|nr:hypothetical protein [Phenylobacterium sp.]